MDNNVDEKCQPSFDNVHLCAAASAIVATVSAIAASAVATAEEAAGFVEEDEATMAHAMVDVFLELVMMIDD